ncbi:hypothetical protein BTW08_02160 [Salinicola sp. MH3R3-1]|uniref:MBL fold metallo-hydrolase n=1 Tax=Salinicola sp. MH3R3-1 TaxID=1928762 RepID=UPI00094E8254|nr:MBL fold metallo-hydrolase [Salinicola sp. MH3R3-1]OLO09329.1 hypothetical protein BTW08_02160 [Salinicola sp. MH3R3-1]
MKDFHVGGIRLRAVREMEDRSFEIHQFFPTSDEASLVSESDWLKPPFLDPETRCITLSIHTWVIDTGWHRVLVDTCVGNDKERHTRTHWTNLNTPFLDRLTAAGVPPESVDYVFCTHLHADHVGWNTCLVNGEWRPTFPNATYLIGRTEFDYWAAALKDDDGTGHHLAAYRDSVLPVIQAGQVEVVDDGFMLDDCLSVHPAPGHTPGHVAIWLRSRGASCVFTGDVIHHPIQIRHPDWSCIGCEEPEQANATRRRLIDEITDTSTLLMTGHFIAPHAGRVRTSSGAIEFEFADDGETWNRDHPRVLRFSPVG